MAFQRRKVGQSSSSRRRSRRQTVHDDLTSLYRDDRGRLRDLSHFDSARRSRLRGVFVTLLVLLTFVSGMLAAAFFLFRNQERFTGEGVTVTVTAPERITSGEDIRYTIRYGNEESLVLGNVELSLRYPKGFTFLEATPPPANTSGTERGGTWTVGTLPRGREGTIEVRGKLVGEVNTQVSFQALLTYKPANFNAEFQEVASATTTIASSVLTLEMKGPDVALPDAEVTYTMLVTNEAKEPVPALELHFDAPEHFLTIETKPERDGAIPRWTFTGIKAGERKTITVRGKFLKTIDAGEQTLKARVGIGKGSAFSLQKEVETVTNIVKGDLLVGLAVNGSAGSQPVNFGEQLAYTVRVKNGADVPMEQLQVKTIVQSPALDWKTFEAEKAGKRDGSTVSWTRNELKNLRVLDPGKEETMTFRIRVKDRKEGLNLEDLRIESHAEVTVGKAKGLPTPLVVNSTTITSDINSDLRFTSDARYFTADGTKIGEGPLPPRVGQTTTYRLQWTMTNTLHEVLSMKASTLLPLNMTFVRPGPVSHGTLLYNPDTRAVEWTLHRLPTTAREVVVDFFVSLTPDATMVGKVLPLTNEIAFEGRDKITGGLLRTRTVALTTALDGDEYGQGKGVVVD